MTLKFKTYIEIPVTIEAEIIPEEKGDFYCPYEPEHPEDVTGRFDLKEAQDCINQELAKDWITDLIMEKVEERRGDVLVDNFRNTYREPLIGRLRTVNIRPAKLTCPESREPELTEQAEDYQGDPSEWAERKAVEAEYYTDTRGER